MSNREHEGNGRDGAEQTGSAQASGAAARDAEPKEPSASADLSEGLDLVLHAARKAVRNIDLGRLEDLGRRARQSLENVGPDRVEELGRKAAEKLDPRRIEEIAEETGRELLSVVERVADRMEKAVAGSGFRRPGSSEGTTDQAADDEPPARVRVEDDS